MVDEVLFLVASWCPHCRKLKEKWKPLFESGIIRAVDVESEEGRRIVEETGAEYVPTCILKKNGGYALCRVD